MCNSLIAVESRIEAECFEIWRPQNRKQTFMSLFLSFSSNGRTIAVIILRVPFTPFSAPFPFAAERSSKIQLESLGRTVIERFWGRSSAVITFTGERI